VFTTYGGMIGLDVVVVIYRANLKKYKMTGNLLFNLNILKRGFTSRVRDCKSIAHLRRSGLSIQSYGLTAPGRTKNPFQKRNNVCERNFKEFVNVYLMAKKG